MENKEIFNLINRLNEIMKEQEKLELEYNKIIFELHSKIPNLKDDVNLQPKRNIDELIDALIDGSYIDEVGEFTRIYPIRNCCVERLNIVKKKVRKYKE